MSKKMEIKTKKYIVEVGGAILNLENKRGHTPIMEAICNNPPLNLIQYLLEKKAHLDTKTKHGNSILHVAASYSAHLSILHFLLQSSNFDVNLFNNEGLIFIFILIFILILIFIFILFYSYFYFYSYFNFNFIFIFIFIVFLIFLFKNDRIHTSYDLLFEWKSGCTSDCALSCTGSRGGVGRKKNFKRTYFGKQQKWRSNRSVGEFWEKRKCLESRLSSFLQVGFQKIGRNFFNLQQNHFRFLQPQTSQNTQVHSLQNHFFLFHKIPTIQSIKRKKKKLETWKYSF